MTLEPYVSAEIAAQFMGVKKRQMLKQARQGMAGAYVFSGEQRHVWVFRLSELAAAIDPKIREQKREPQPERRYDLAIRRSSLK